MKCIFKNGTTCDILSHDIHNGRLMIRFTLGENVISSVEEMCSLFNSENASYFKVEEKEYQNMLFVEALIFIDGINEYAAILMETK